MSLKISIDKLTREQSTKIKDELVIKINNNKHAVGAPTKYIFPYLITNDDVYVPFAYGLNELKLKRKNREDLPAIDITFTGKLRDEQVEVRKEAFETLSKTGSILLSLRTGFGKTFLAINLAAKIKLKTLIIVNKVILLKQWEESIIKVCPDAKIQKLINKKSKFDKESDFYIVNAINVEKFQKDFFKDIGTVIIDELHLIMAETLSKSLQHVQPRYLLGLSATAYRIDGLDPVIEIYFGKNRIIREMYRYHKVYYVNTGFTPEIKVTDAGKVNWSLLLKDQSEDENRNKLIIDITQKFKKNTFLILTKRVDQGRLLVQKLSDIGEHVSSLIGSQQDFDKECRILVGTTQKCGTGFDFPKLDALIIASDAKDYFEQILGRIFRKENTTPLVFDLVDNNPILMKHYKDRKKIYMKYGGEIVSYNKNKERKDIEDESYNHKRLL